MPLSMRFISSIFIFMYYTLMLHFFFLKMYSVLRTRAAELDSPDAKTRGPNPQLEFKWPCRAPDGGGGRVRAPHCSAVLCMWAQAGGGALPCCLIFLLPSPTPLMLLPPKGPSTSLFPGCISQGASSGHEPFPPNTDCICCLSTTIECCSYGPNLLQWKDMLLQFIRWVFIITWNTVAQLCTRNIFKITWRHSHRSQFQLSSAEHRRWLLSLEHFIIRVTQAGKAGSIWIVKPLSLTS